MKPQRFSCVAWSKTSLIRTVKYLLKIVFHYFGLPRQSFILKQKLLEAQRTRLIRGSSSFSSGHLVLFHFCRQLKKRRRDKLLIETGPRKIYCRALEWLLSPASTRERERERVSVRVHECVCMCLVETESETAK